jgi:hypothetical protein|tara:strand:- start:59 stop:337 length:279 start_codon:yes stop_codon:yes gene_type:complete
MTIEADMDEMALDYLINILGSREAAIEGYDTFIAHAENDRRLDQLRADNKIHLDYLKETDWYATRKADSGTAIPDDITAARALARSSIVEVV